VGLGMRDWSMSVEELNWLKLKYFLNEKKLGTIVTLKEVYRILRVKSDRNRSVVRRLLRYLQKIHVIRIGILNDDYVYEINKKIPFNFKIDDLKEIDYLMIDSEFSDHFKKLFNNLKLYEKYGDIFGEGEIWKQ